MLSEQHGKKLVEIARDVITAKCRDKPVSINNRLKQLFPYSMGSYVTIKKNGQVRGCMGNPNPTMLLAESVAMAAIDAGFNDPRFPPIDKEELSLLSFEINVCSRPKLLMVRNPEEYLNSIDKNYEGIILKGLWESAVILPQMISQQGWTIQQMLENASIRCGLPPQSWKDFNTCTIHKFQNQIFIEQSPNGHVLVLAQS